MVSASRGVRIAGIHPGTSVSRTCCGRRFNTGAAPCSRGEALPERREGELRLPQREVRLRLEPAVPADRGRVEAVRPGGAPAREVIRASRRDVTHFPHRHLGTAGALRAARQASVCRSVAFISLIRIRISLIRGFLSQVRNGQTAVELSRGLRCPRGRRLRRGSRSDESRARARRAAKACRWPAAPRS